MKIAIPSDDGIHMAEHFGRAKYFVVYESDGDKVGSKEVRGNAHSWHHTGNHDADGCNGHGGDHQELVDALYDCNVIICHGIGRKALEVLVRKGIEPLLTNDDLTPEQAANAYLAGNLKTGASPCGCGH